MASATPRIAMGAFLNVLVLELFDRHCCSQTYLNCSISSLDPHLSKADLKQLWTAVCPSGDGSIDLAALHSQMSSRFGKDSSNQSSSIVDKVLEPHVEMQQILMLDNVLGEKEDIGEMWRKRRHKRVAKVLLVIIFF